ncbi:MAG: 4Fe-4S binding protein, partial [Nitrospirota bacterium]
VISLDDKEFPHIDYDHCKGCLICYEECPIKAITVERESSSNEYKKQ